MSENQQDEPSSQSGPSPLRLMVWNINSLPPTARNCSLRYGSFKGFFDAFKIDILCLQEAKLLEEKITKELAVVEGYQSFWACSKGKKGYSGVVTFSSQAWSPLTCDIDPLSDSTTPTTSDRKLNQEGRLVITDHGAFVLVNVYVPNASSEDSLQFKMRFLKALQSHCAELVAAGKELLIVGDLNLAATQADVHSSYGDIDKMYSPEEREFILKLITKESGGYIDVWRTLHPDARNAFTVWDEKTSARAFNQGCRIDYVLATPGIASKIKSCEILGSDEISPKWSDHAALLVEFQEEGVRPLPDHPPCAEWTRLLNRFQDSKQRTILSMFTGAGGGSAGGVKRKTPAVTATTTAAVTVKDNETKTANERRTTSDKKKAKTIASFFNSPSSKT